MTDPRNLPANDEPGLSRVILEPVMARCVEVGDMASAEAIRAELEARVWQWTNPYAGWTWPTTPSGRTVA